ncbi:NanQ anomerase/TabA/YiaL family protein [Flavitalea sp.]|nr:YhcH/YjgK/YiaL family protein [Flavitalea sp.]
MKKLSSAIILMILLNGLVPYRSFAQSKLTSAREINSWYKKHDWLNGLPRAPHESVNKEEFAKEYQANKALWDRAFSYLRETDFSNIKPGRYAIEGDSVYALISEGPTKELNQSRWEAHQKYFDIHFVVTGNENIGIAPVNSGTIAKVYDQEKDIAFYTSTGKFHTLDSSNIFIVSPRDAHQPGLKAERSTTVKKVVIKIRKSNS